MTFVSYAVEEPTEPVTPVAEEAVEEPIEEPTGNEYVFQKDESGNLVLDENGNPIVLNTIPENADQIATIVDQLDPNRYIDIYVAWEDERKEIGNTATLIAVLHGYENAVYTLQWQNSEDDVNWTDVEGETGERFAIEITEENCTDYWRVQVIITDVME